MEFQGCRLFRHITANLHITPEQVWRLLVPSRHAASTRHYAASLIITRIQIISIIFAVAVPLWAIADLLIFDAPVSIWLAMLRFAAALVFVLMAYPRSVSEARPYAKAIVLLLTMMMVSSAFFLASITVLNSGIISGTQVAMSQFYIFMPVVTLAGLAIFPLTALEIILLSLPVFVVAVFGFSAGHIHFLTLQENFITLWCMVMMLGVSVFSGMSQLHCMETMVHRAMTDPLTGIFSRRSGMETLRLLFHLSAGSKQPLSVVFLDIDHFKLINDTFGHDSGDQVLQQLTQRLRGLLRHSDVLVRWGGEEFLILLPEMPAHQLMVLIDRLVATGFGSRPDGKPLTASIGIAETIVDKVGNWRALVELADQRMYEAKRQGRARALLPGNVMIHLQPVTGDAICDGAPHSAGEPPHTPP
ncbi:MAG: GGDEF domain-containing protein [Candidatus Accumulibacter sp.]|jgi:diguanylate cyclase (GGDEF)-like protein|nr:GGDEF domain-containing protein [Accumulibacter sp.]